jgi:hypothetical protein
LGEEGTSEQSDIGVRQLMSVFRIAGLFGALPTGTPLLEEAL